MRGDINPEKAVNCRSKWLPEPRVNKGRYVRVIIEGLCWEQLFKECAQGSLHYERNIITFLDALLGGWSEGQKSSDGGTV